MTGPEQDSATENQDRLPWLEGDDEYYEDEGGISIGRLIAAVVVGLVAIGLIVGGVFWLRNRTASGTDDRLITAPVGDYKEKPLNPGGMEVEGSGDVAYQASQGGEVNSTIDLTKVPEAPVAAPLQDVGSKNATADASQAAAQPAKAAAKAGNTQPAKSSAIANIGNAPKAVAPAKVVTPKTVAVPPAAGGAAAQLGAFSSRSGAEHAWKALSGRFGYLAGLNHSVEAAEVSGRTLYRLRVNGGDVGSVCAKLKVAGEVCNVVR